MIRGSPSSRARTWSLLILTAVFRMPRVKMTSNRPRPSLPMINLEDSAIKIPFQVVSSLTKSTKFTNNPKIWTKVATHQWKPTKTLPTAISCQLSNLNNLLSCLKTKTPTARLSLLKMEWIHLISVKKKKGWIASTLGMILSRMILEHLVLLSRLLRLKVLTVCGAHKCR